MGEFYAAIQQDPSAPRNPAAFPVSITLAAVEDREARGILIGEVPGVVRSTGTGVEERTDEFYLWNQNAPDEVGPRALPAARERKAAEARAKLAALDLPIQKLENRLTELIGAAWPSPKFRFEGARAIDETTPTQHARYLEIRTHFKDDPVTKVRRAVIEAAASGDTETVLAFSTAPAVIKGEIFDEATTSRITDALLERNGTAKEVASLRMGIELSRYLISKGLAAIAAIAGGGEDEAPPLEAPDGRLVRRRQ